MAITTLKVLASLIQLHGPGATIQSDHQGIDALLNDLRGQDSGKRRKYISDEAGFIRGADTGGFRRGGIWHGGGGIRQSRFRSRILV